MCFGGNYVVPAQETTAERLNRLEKEAEYHERLAQKSRSLIDGIKAMTIEGSDKPDEPKV